MSVKTALSAALAAALLSAVPFTARAAESYDNCLSFIPSIPAVLSTQGVHCMNKDLAGNLESGVAITVNTNNVTIDCNGFKLGNLQASVENYAEGIQANSRANVTVRNCNVRGFYVGIALSGSGHLVEDNRVESSGLAGLYVSGDASVVRRNSVFDTGTGFHEPLAGISLNGTVDVFDNSITGVYAVAASDGNVRGIYINPQVGGRIEGNAIRDLVADGTGTPYGIFINNTGGGLSVARNRITNAGSVAGSGIQCAGLPQSMLTDNHMLGFSAGFAGCADVGLNYSQ